MEADDATSAWAALYSSAGGLRAGGSMSGVRAFGLAHPTVSFWSAHIYIYLNGVLLPHAKNVRAHTAAWCKESRQQCCTAGGCGSDAAAGR